MNPRQVGITVDCDDAARLAEFWEHVLGYARRPSAPGSPYVTIERGDDSPDGPPFVTFQTVPEPKAAKARLHFDLFVDQAQQLVDACTAPGQRTRAEARSARHGAGMRVTSRATPRASRACAVLCAENMAATEPFEVRAPADP